MEREEKVDRELAAAAIAGGCDGGWGVVSGEVKTWGTLSHSGLRVVG